MLFIVGFDRLLACLSFSLLFSYISQRREVYPISRKVILSRNISK